MSATGHWLPRLRQPAALAVLAAMIALRPVLEKSMALHMLLQLPALAGAGVLLADTLPPWLRRGVARCDQHGIAGLFAIMFLSAYWMIPRALESALTSPPAELAKFATWIAAGLLLPGMLARANTITQLFFLGNFTAMTAIAGMLYQDAPERLCNYYLRDDQLIAGTGLVIYAIAAALAWLACQRNKTPAG
jgi:hypothetical protein